MSAETTHEDHIRWRTEPHTAGWEYEYDDTLAFAWALAEIERMRAALKLIDSGANDPQEIARQALEGDT